MRSPPLTDRSMAAYAEVTDRDLLRHLRDLGDALDDVRILHVNSTATGGGVAELLRSIVPLCRDLGIETEWLVMEADESFFEVTKAIHNGLQGSGTPLSDEMRATYRAVTERNAGAIDDEHDIVVLHDPQPLGMVETLRERLPNAGIVWRCHLDLTDPSSEHLAFVAEYAESIDRAILSRDVYEERIAVPSASVVHPSIDPLSPKNEDVDDETAAAERDRLDQISFDEPIVTQVSRFDPWKDQFGTLEAYRRIASEMPDVQLALAGGRAADDPEAEAIYDRVAAEAADEPDVHLLTDLPDSTVNVLQRDSDVVVQKSLREGFGLVVSEALWKRTPVVGSTAGGIPLQIEDGRNGYLLEPDDVSGVAQRVETLLADDERRVAFGRRGRTDVRDRFLLPRQLADCLDVFAELLDEPLS